MELIKAKSFEIFRPCSLFNDMNESMRDFRLMKLTTCFDIENCNLLIAIFLAQTLHRNYNRNSFYLPEMNGFFDHYR